MMIGHMNSRWLQREYSNLFIFWYLRIDIISLTGNRILTVGSLISHIIIDSKSVVIGWTKKIRFRYYDFIMPISTSQISDKMREKNSRNTDYPIQNRKKNSNIMLVSFDACAMCSSNHSRLTAWEQIKKIYHRILFIWYAEKVTQLFNIIRLFVHNKILS